MKHPKVEGKIVLVVFVVAAYFVLLLLCLFLLSPFSQTSRRRTRGAAGKRSNGEDDGIDTGEGHTIREPFIRAVCHVSAKTPSDKSEVYVM